MINCPICNLECEKDEVSGSHAPLFLKNKCLVFLCYNCLASDPLHYYSHMTVAEEPDKIVYQEFSIDLGIKSVLYAINYLENTSQIKSGKDALPLELNFIITPDFPGLDSLRSKIKTAMIFS